MNTQQAIKTLRAKLDAYEQRYGVQSENLDAALDDEEIVETFDICSWLIDYRLWSELTARNMALADDKMTMKDCPACPMYRGGSRPYCAKTGKAVRLEDPLPLVCRAPLKAKGV